MTLKSDRLELSLSVYVVICLLNLHGYFLCSSAVCKHNFIIHTYIGEILRGVFIQIPTWLLGLSKTWFSKSNVAYLSKLLIWCTRSIAVRVPYGYEQILASSLQDSEWELCIMRRKVWDYILGKCAMAKYAEHSKYYNFVYPGVPTLEGWLNVGVIYLMKFSLTH